MHGRFLHANREIFRSPRMWRHTEVASGRRGAVADDARAAEVGPWRSSAEADEQARAPEGGVGGAKARAQGEHGRVAHAPDAGPGGCVPATRPCTASSKAAEEGAVHGVVPPRRH